MRQGEEWFEVVDPEGRVRGRARRRECHGNPALLHRVAHVLVVDGRGRLYLQKRSAAKDIQPGKWDTSVGGHLRPGEEPEAAALRELREELGIGADKLEFLYRYLMRSPVETELVDTYRMFWDGPIAPDPGEIECGRFWTCAEIEAELGRACFSPNFEDEYRRYRDWLTASRPAEGTAQNGGIFHG